MRTFSISLVLFIFSLSTIFSQEPNWTKKTPTKKPSSRVQLAMAFDESRSKLVLFGGTENSIFLGDTWEWDGTDWTNINPSSYPAARSEHAMAYDGVLNQVLLFGGTTGTTTTFNTTILNDTWEWDGTVWNLKSPVNSPSARRNSAMAYDAAHHQIVLFGGYNNDTGLLNDTWVWDGTNWTQLFPSTVPPAGIPPARWTHKMAYDAARGRVVLFGGLTGANWTGDTWEWDGVNWSLVTPTISPQPQPMNNHAMAYDPTAKKVILFGGHVGGLGEVNDTWLWNGSNWIIQNPQTPPTARQGHAMAADTNRAEVVVFGGNDPSGVVNDTWVWNGGNLTQIFPVVLVHGWCSDPSSFGQMKDLLELDGLTVAEPFDYGPLTKVPSTGGTGVTIEELAAIFAGHVLRILRETGATQVDVVTHSMGGLIVRAWMSGMVSVNIPYEGQIRKLITIATPHYGAKQASLADLNTILSYGFFGLHQCSTTQMEQLRFGSEFVSKLHDNWMKSANQNPYLFDTRNFLYIVGTRASRGRLECNEYLFNTGYISEGCSDGIVDISSAVLQDSPENMIRYVPYKHAKIGGSGAVDLFPPFFSVAINNINNSDHKTYRLVEKFLKDGVVISQNDLSYIPPHLRLASSEDAKRQEGLLFIRLKDSQTNQPISSSFINISMRPQPSFRQQDNRSSITAWGVNLGTYEVNIRALGYIPLTISNVNVQPGRPTVPDAIGIGKR